QEGDTIAGGIAVQHLLAVAEAGHVGRTEAVAEQVMNYLRVAAAEGGGKVGTRESAVVFFADGQPGGEVKLGGIDERTVHVPDDPAAARVRHPLPAPQIAQVRRVRRYQFKYSRKGEKEDEQERWKKKFRRGYFGVAQSPKQSSGGT